MSNPHPINDVQMDKQNNTRSRSRSRSNSPKSPALSESSDSSDSSRSRERSLSGSRSRSNSPIGNSLQPILQQQQPQSLPPLIQPLPPIQSHLPSQPQIPILQQQQPIQPLNNNNTLISKNRNTIYSTPTTTLQNLTIQPNSISNYTVPMNSIQNNTIGSTNKNMTTAGTQSLKLNRESIRDRDKRESIRDRDNRDRDSRRKSSSSRSSSKPNFDSIFRKSSSSSSSSNTNGNLSKSGDKYRSSSSTSSPSLKFKKNTNLSQKAKDSFLDLLAEDMGDNNIPSLPPTFSLQSNNNNNNNNNNNINNNNNYNGNGNISSNININSNVEIEMKPINDQATNIENSDYEITDEVYRKMLSDHSKIKSDKRKMAEQKLFENIILSSDSGNEFESDGNKQKRNRLMDRYVSEMDEDKKEVFKCKIKKKKQDQSTRDKLRESRNLTSIRRKLNEQLSNISQSRKRRNTNGNGSTVPTLSDSDDEILNLTKSRHSSKHRSSRHSSSRQNRKQDLQAPPLSSDDEDDNEIDKYMLQKLKSSSGSVPSLFQSSSRRIKPISSSTTSSSSSLVYEEKNLQAKYGCSEELDPNFQSKWFQIIRKEMPKSHKKIKTLRSRGLSANKSIANMMKQEIKKRINIKQSQIKPARDIQARSRRLVKEMGAYWRKFEKDEREAKKRAEKEESMQRKREEEAREAKRQRNKLNFLISQTELYSHFMSKKLTGDSSSTTSQQPDMPQMPTDLEGTPQKQPKKSDSDGSDSDSGEEEEGEKLTEQERLEQEQLTEKAKERAKKALDEQLSRTKAFDDDINKIKNENQQAENSITTGTTIDETIETPMDLDGTLIPTNFPGKDSSLKQPTILNASLKSYQLKGMSWIVNLYDQGINGILADEMGLGKTIQSIAVLANLAEEKGIWGPFLIVTPKSTLHNWYQEFKRFVPSFKVLPYWGSQKQRETLRKYWNVKKLYQKNSPFHVLVTSYNVICLDEKYFHRIRWQYMVLDEAHSIKSSASNRWKTLMSFNCRNRLLLTGTPIQNNMAELWALLHFIMPTLFDSHDEFAEWFSKDIENHANTGGGKLNEHQLNRLHLILKPFMLRRMKKDVENEMPSKHEIEVMCSLTIRQKKLYQRIRSDITISELFGTSFSESSMKNLMNLVMQFRKVCNHPETFERSECKAPLFFQDPISKDVCDSTLPQCPNHLKILTSYPRNPIHFIIPKLIYRSDMWPSTPITSTQCILDMNLKRFSIFNPSYISNSLDSDKDSIFNFSRFINTSPMEMSNYFLKYSMVELYIESQSQKNDLYDSLAHCFEENPLLPNNIKYMLLEPSINSIQEKLSTENRVNSILHGKLATSPYEKYQDSISLIQSTYSICPKVSTPPIGFSIRDQLFTRKDFNTTNLVSQSKLLFNGTKDQNNQVSLTQYPLNTSDDFIEDLEIQGGLMGGLYNVFGSSQIWVPSFHKSLNDSGKLQVLDKLLKQLKAEGHRVLIYSQFTKMINILEDFMIFRKYKFLRLDGSYKLEDRRDMVDDFQTDPSNFAFLLSTRACGIGINLTAADTVIFYDSDWNPTVDEQAMDRCHRLGQVRPVTVYRLITKGTIEERIIKRAKQKHHIQSIVIAGGKFENNTDDQDENSPENMNEVVSFLLEDDEVEEKLRQYQMNLKKRKFGADNSIQDKPFNPSDIPASKLMKGRPPKDKSNELQSSANNIQIDMNTGQPIAKPPPKKKGPKPGSKRNKIQDNPNILINPQTGETTLPDGTPVQVQPPPPPSAKGKKKAAPKDPNSKPRGRGRPAANQNNTQPILQPQ